MLKSFKSIFLSVFILCFLMFSAQGFSADFASVMKEAQAKYAKFESSFKDMTINQETTMVTNAGNMPMKMTMYMKDKKFRAESNMAMPHGGRNNANVETVIIHDGKDTWMVSPFMGKTKMPSGKEKDYENKSNWWAMISDKAQITGTEKIDGRECYVIEATEKAMNPFNKIWVDKDALVMVKAENKTGNGKIMSAVFSDFKDVKGGWEMPYKTEVFMDGKLMSSSVIKSIDFNKGLSDDLFDASKIQAQEFNMQDMMKQMMQQQGSAQQPK